MNPGCCTLSDIYNIIISPVWKPTETIAILQAKLDTWLCNRLHNNGRKPSKQLFIWAWGEFRDCWQKCCCLIYKRARVIKDHDDVIKWKHFPRYWPFVRGNHRSTVNSPHKGQWRGVLMFSLICVWINGWVKNREAGDLRRYRVHCDVSAPAMSGSSCVLMM